MTGDVSRELGRPLGVPVELVGYETVAKLIAGLKADAWDVAFLAMDPARAGDVAFTAPYMEVEVTYLAPESSDMRSVAHVDRTGVRIAVGEKNAADLFLAVRSGAPGCPWPASPVRLSSPWGALPGAG